MAEEVVWGSEEVVVPANFRMVFPNVGQALDYVFSGALADLPNYAAVTMDPPKRSPLNKPPARPTTRRGWDRLSVAYRRRIVREIGHGDEAAARRVYESGDRLSPIVTRRTPRHPMDAVRHPDRYPDYVGKNFPKLIRRSGYDEVQGGLADSAGPGRLYVYDGPPGRAR